MNTKETKTSFILFIILGVIFSVAAYFIGFKHDDNSKYTLIDNVILGFIGSSSVIFVPIIKQLFKNK